MRVPSVLVPEAWNLILNPGHPDAGHLRIVSDTRVAFDERLSRSR
jgi:RES domain-containing protein